MGLAAELGRALSQCTPADDHLMAALITKGLLKYCEPKGSRPYCGEDLLWADSHAVWQARRSNRQQCDVSRVKREAIFSALGCGSTAAVEGHREPDPPVRVYSRWNLPVRLKYLHHSLKVTRVEQRPTRDSTFHYKVALNCTKLCNLKVALRGIESCRSGLALLGPTEHLRHLICEAYSRTVVSVDLRWHKPAKNSDIVIRVVLTDNSNQIRMIEANFNRDCHAGLQVKHVGGDLGGKVLWGWGTCPNHDLESLLLEFGWDSMLSADALYFLVSEVIRNHLEHYDRLYTSDPLYIGVTDRSLARQRTEAAVTKLGFAWFRTQKSLVFADAKDVHFNPYHRTIYDFSRRNFVVSAI